MLTNMKFLSCQQQEFEISFELISLSCVEFQISYNSFRTPEGTFVQDEEVEFDSDDDRPPTPPPGTLPPFILEMKFGNNN